MTPHDDATAEAFVRGYYRAVNESRWDDVVACFHEDAVLFIPSQAPKVGHEAIRRFYESHGRRFPEHHDDVPLLMLDGDRVMTLVDFRGVDLRGVAVTFWTAGIFTIAAGLIQEYRVIFDTAALPPRAPGAAP